MQEEIRRLLSKHNNRSKKSHLNSQDLAGFFRMETESQYTSAEDWILTGRFLRLMSDRSGNSGQHDNPCDDLFSTVAPQWKELLAQSASAWGENCTLFEKAAVLAVATVSNILIQGNEGAGYKATKALDDWQNRWRLKSSRYHFVAEMILISAAHCYEGKVSFDFPKAGWESTVIELQSYGEFINFPQGKAVRPPVPLELYAGIGRDEYEKRYLDEAEMLLNTGVMKLLGPSQKREISKHIQKKVSGYCDRVEGAMAGTPGSTKRRRMDSTLERDLRFALDRIVYCREWKELAKQEAERTKSQTRQFTTATREHKALLRVYKGVKRVLRSIGLPRHVAFDDPDHLPEDYDFLQDRADMVNGIYRLLDKSIKADSGRIGSS